MRRLLGTCLAAGLTLLYSRAADARPSLEVTTSLGGADASEYLVRVANPESTEDSGSLELRSANDDRAMVRGTFSVPAQTTRYFRLPGEKGQRFEVVAVTSEGTFRGHPRYSGDSGLVVFDIPPQDSERLHELRVHTQKENIVIAHAVFDETTHAPVLPARAAVYDGVALVMIPARVFVGLPLSEREALIMWVRAGGAIALSGPRPAELGDAAELGLGRVYVLPVDPWSVESNGDLAVQETIAALAEDHRAVNHMFGEAGIDTMPVPSLDPNRGYRSVLALAGVLLVLQSLVTAFAFRRLAVRRGMGPAYRFVVGSSAVTFAAVIGLGIYAKGGFRARARELSFADAASGESVAWVERTRTYFAGSARSVAVTPRDALNDLTPQDPHAVLRMDDARGSVVLDDLAVRPWETTAVTERGTTTLGGGVTIAYANGNIVVHNATGSALRNVVVSRPDGGCLAFGDIANGAEKTSGTPQTCTDFGPAWSDYERGYAGRLQNYLTPHRLVLFGQIEEGTTSNGDFPFEKRTTIVRVIGGAS